MFVKDRDAVMLHTQAVSFSIVRNNCREQFSMTQPRQVLRFGKLTFSCDIAEGEGVVLFQWFVGLQWPKHGVDDQQDCIFGVLHPKCVVNGDGNDITDEPIH